MDVCLSIAAVHGALLLFMRDVIAKQIAGDPFFFYLRFFDASDHFASSEFDGYVALRLTTSHVHILYFFFVSSSTW